MRSNRTLHVIDSGAEGNPLNPLHRKPVPGKFQLASHGVQSKLVGDARVSIGEKLRHYGRDPTLRVGLVTSIDAQPSSEIRDGHKHVLQFPLVPVGGTRVR